MERDMWKGQFWAGIEGNVRSRIDDFNTKYNYLFAGRKLADMLRMRKGMLLLVLVVI